MTSIAEGDIAYDPSASSEYSQWDTDCALPCGSAWSFADIAEIIKVDVAGGSRISPFLDGYDEAKIFLRPANISLTGANPGQRYPLLYWTPQEEHMIVE